MKLKLFLLVFISIYFVSSTDSQFIVESPGMEAQMGIENATLSEIAGSNTESASAVTTMQALQQRVEALMTEAQWAKDLKTVTQLAVLIENTICTYKNLSFWMTKSGGINGCIISFRYQIYMLNIQQAIDLVNLALMEGFRLTHEGRLESLSKSINAFQQAHLGFSSLQNSLMLSSYNMSIKKHYGTSMSWKYNRNSF